MNLLFCVNSEEFTLKITQKPYPKYQFQPHQAGRKSSLNAINRVENSINQQKNTSEASESLYEHYIHFKALTKSSCAFCIPKSTKSSKRED